MAQHPSKLNIRRTPLDGALAVFLFTAAVSAWASYDQGAARAKFALLAIGVGLFYLLAWLPPRRFTLAIDLLGLTAALLAVYFLFTQDWITYPADLGAFNRLGLWWTGVRPQVALPVLHPNIVGGLIAALAPIMLYRAWYARQAGRAGLLLALLGVGGLAALGLLMTSSRAAWFTLAFALLVWLVWQSAPRLELRLPAVLMWLSGAILLVALGWLVWERLPTLLRLMPGAPSAGGRLELAVYTPHLVLDFPYTGGGLAAFPGLYSHYMMVLPHFLFGYAHNLYLDIAVEQGLAGLAAWLAIWVGSVALLVRSGGEPGSPQRAFRGALLAGMLVVGLHGLVDDSFYGMGGTPLLFALPGLAVAALGVRSPRPATFNQPGSVRRNMRRWLLPLAFLAVVAGVILSRPSLLGAWYADLGAISMARVELHTFPSGVWDSGENMGRFAPA